MGRQYQALSDSIKAYLTMPLVLPSPIEKKRLIKGKPLVLYIIALDHSLGALLA